MVMEASCKDYLRGINDDIEGGMGFILSSWDNTDATLDAGQYAAQCSTPAASCDNATSQISDFTVFQWGYTEDVDTNPAPTPTPTPTPTPGPAPIEPADFKMFIGQSSKMGGPHNFYVKGLDGAYLETSNDKMSMGLDNKAFILDYAYDDSESWSYWHDYLGGTLYFDVDVS